MPVKLRSSDLETATARLKLKPRKAVYRLRVSNGVALGYRRTEASFGTWSAIVADGSGGEQLKKIADADDREPADNKTVLSFDQAMTQARLLARGEDEQSQSLLTIDRALVDYKADLISRGARAYNAKHPRHHLTALLLAKPVAMLTSKELKAWRDSLLGTIAPATINRVCNSICAALELARSHDPRIKNREAWETGLAGLPDAQQARNVVISDAQVRALVAEAYARDPQLGLFVDVLAVTGTRPSQAARLRVEDLHDHSPKPKLMMPKSGKGGGRNRSQQKSQLYSVPITPALSKKLKAAAKGRAGDAPLLLLSDGSTWGDEPGLIYRRPVREVVKVIGEDPDEVTLYALRHSSIVRMLLKNIPIRLIAALHNTSVGQIERNYSKHITEHHSDDLTRTGLLSEPMMPLDNVVALAS